MEQSLKGVLKTLTLTNNEVILKPALGREYIIKRADIVDIKYVAGTFTQNGYMAFCTFDGKGSEINSPQDASISKNGIMFQMSKNDIAEFVYNNLRNNIHINTVDTVESTGPTTIINNYTTNNTVSKNTEIKKAFGALKCPSCKGTNIQLWGTSANMKEFQRTGLNLNPLHPLTPFKTKTIRKEKTSGAKLALGLVTGGSSLLVTGTKNKKHNEYFCQDCGKRWIGK